MRLADQMLLAQIREHLLADMPEQDWALVEQEVEKAGGVDKVDGYAGVLLRDAIEKAKKNKVETVMSEFKAGKLKSSSGKKVKSRKQAIAIALSEQRRVKKEMLEKASFGGDRSAAGRYAAEQRWKGHAKSDKPSGNTAGRVGRVGAMGNFRNKALYQLAGEIEEAYRRQGKKVPAALKPYLEAMYSLDRIDSNYFMDSGRQIVGYFLSNLTGLKNEGGVKEIKDELKRRLKEGEKRDGETVQSDKGEAPATEDDSLIVRRPDLLPEEAFRDKTQFKGYRQTETYKKIVQNKKAEIARDKDGTARHRGTSLTDARDNLAMEEEMLRSFESGQRSARQILGSPFKKTDARAILQARVADASAKVQALEEYEDESSPGYFAS